MAPAAIGDGGEVQLDDDARETVTTKRMHLYSGSSHPELAEEIASHLGIANETAHGLGSAIE